MKPTEFFSQFRSSPKAFAERLFGIHVYPGQNEILDSVRDRKETYVKGANAVGKTLAGAVAVLWFLYSYWGNSIVLTTAPTDRQVEKLLWGEIRTLHSRSKIPLGGHLTLKSLYPVQEISKWYALGFSTNEIQRFQGFHAPRLLVVVDEANGFPDEMWPSIESMLMGADCKLLALSNPIVPSGEFYRRCRSNRAIKLDGFNHPNVLRNDDSIIPGGITADWIEDKKVRWGETSAVYQARILAEFPESAEDRISTIAQVDAAITREPSKDDCSRGAIVACDVARYGSSKTSVVVMNGLSVIDHYQLMKSSVTDVCGLVIEMYRKHSQQDAPATIVIDDSGVGGGVTDNLKSLDYPAVPFVGGAASTAMDEKERPRYLNLRAEAYDLLRNVMDEIHLDDHPCWEAQLPEIVFYYNAAGKFCIESKEKMRARGLASPDDADALSMAVWALIGETPVDAEIAFAWRKGYDEPNEFEEISESRMMDNPEIWAGV